MIAPGFQYPMRDRRVYRVIGSDARDLLQRISTADMTPLQDGRAVATLLTNEKGRVVDLAGVVPEPGGSLLVGGIGDTDGRIGSWLERFIIMEDVRLTDISGEYTAVAVYAVDPDGLWTIPVGTSAPVVPVMFGRHSWGMAFVPSSGKFDGLAVVDQPTFTRHRIVSGVPWIPGEIGERRHPLEARLRPLISFTKGCYIGQEVIARLDAYRKIQLALTRFEGDLPSGLQIPAVLSREDGTEAGILTTISDARSGVCGLGFVRIDLLSSAPDLRTPEGTALRPIDTDPESMIYA